MSKDLILTNTEFKSTGIYGTMKSKDESLSLFTLQHAYQIDSEGESIYFPKIPDGIFTCVRRHSPKFGYDLFWIRNVPNNGVDPTDAGKEFYDFIEIHRGNYNRDSDGCILVGLYVGQDFIINSRAAFKELMDFMEGINSFTLTVQSIK